MEMTSYSGRLRTFNHKLIISWHLSFSSFVICGQWVPVARMVRCHWTKQNIVTDYNYLTEQNRLYLSVSSIAVTGPMNCKVFDIRSSADQVNHPFPMVSKPK